MKKRKRTSEAQPKRKGYSVNRRKTKELRQPSHWRDRNAIVSINKARACCPNRYQALTKCEGRGKGGLLNDLELRSRTATGELPPGKRGIR